MVIGLEWADVLNFLWNFVLHTLSLFWSRPPLPRTKPDLNSWEKFFLSQDSGTCGSLGGASEAQTRCKPIIPIFTRSNRKTPPHQLPTWFHRFFPLSLLCQKSSASSHRRCSAGWRGKVFKQILIWIFLSISIYCPWISFSSSELCKFSPSIFCPTFTICSQSTLTICSQSTLTICSRPERWTGACCAGTVLRVNNRDQGVAEQEMRLSLWIQGFLIQIFVWWSIPKWWTY